MKAVSFLKRNVVLCIAASAAFITFIGSMLIANDTALLTFLPLGCFVLSGTDKGKIWRLLLLCRI